MHTVLLTGNRGYIGTVLTKFLKKRLYRVIGLDTNFYKGCSFLPVSPEFTPHRQIIKDIRDIRTEDLKDVDTIIHLAALSNDPLGELNPDITDSINHKATLNIAKIAKETGTKRFIFSSSCSIYGKSSSSEYVNENDKVNPITSYAKAKIDAENGLLKLGDFNFHPVLMRNATVYGISPMLRLDLVVNNLLAWAYFTGKISIMSDGTPWRPIIHVEDFCSAFIAAIKALDVNIHSQIFNIGINEENYQIKDIADEIKKQIPSAQIEIRNKLGPDERSYKVDFRKAKNVLTDFQPKWNLKKGIMELHEYYKKHSLKEKDFTSGKYFRINTIKSLIKNGKLDHDLIKL